MPRNTAPALFIHARRPEWGLARQTADRSGKLRFVFQDGHERAFAPRFAHLMQPAEQPEDVLLKAVEDLDQRSGGLPVAERPDHADLPDFATQLRTFLATWPAGFADPGYRADVRGEGARRRKRHRDAALAWAAARLPPERFAEPLDPAGLFKDTCAVLQATDLAGDRRQRAAIEQLPPARHADLARTLGALLYGEGPHLDRFARFVALLDESGAHPSWSLVTALPALIHPQTHVAVKPTVFERQARRLDPRLIPEKRPNAALYRRYLQLACSVRDRLVAAGHPPRDLLDVRAFLDATLSPRALQRAAP